LYLPRSKCIRDSRSALYTSTNESSYDLPDDLFDKEKGDVKPTKAKKKTVVNGKKPALKRSFNEVEVSS
jgi:hypothetical protein